MVYRVTTEYFKEDPKLIDTFTDLSRDKWIDYCWRIRAYIVGALAKLPDVDYSLPWVIANGRDLSDIMKTYYGDEAGQKFLDLFNENTTNIVSLISYLTKPPANFNKNTDTYYISTVQRIKDKANDLAMFMSDLNITYWPRETIRRQLEILVGDILDQIMFRFEENFVPDLERLDKFNSDIRDMSELFSTGIIQQNPGRFSVI